MRNVFVGKLWFNDLANMFRGFGFVPVWLLVAAILMTVRWPAFRERGLRAWRGEIALALTPMVCGLANEALKLLIRRERPDVDAQTLYRFRPWNEDFWSTAGLGMPSGHTAVAFAAAWVLSRMYPRAAALFILAALGTGVVRVLGRSHFVSDVYIAAVLSYFIALLIWNRVADR